jgi:hypothetical protein
LIELVQTIVTFLEVVHAELLRILTHLVDLANLSHELLVIELPQLVDLAVLLRVVVLRALAWKVVVLALRVALLALVVHELRSVLLQSLLLR